MASDDLDGALVGIEAGALSIGAVARGSAVAIVEDDAGGGGGGLVGAVHQHGSFVGVRVAGEDEVDSAAFKDGHDLGPHLEHVRFFVAVVRAFGVGWVMEEGDRPVGVCLLEVSCEPLGHGTGGTAIDVMRVEADEMGTADLKGIVGLGT